MYVAKRIQFCYTRGTMIKTIDVAGIELDNYSVRETIMNVEKNMSDNGFHTIEEVNMEMLLQAESDEVIREALASVEHTVIAERGILEAVGADSYQRKHEIDHHDFFYEMMKRIERNRKTIFVVGEKMEQTEQMCERIMELYPKCEVIGAEAIEECSGNLDALINEINSQTPDVIISVIPKGGVANGIRKMFRAHKLEKHLNHYSEKQENE